MIRMVSNFYRIDALKAATPGALAEKLRILRGFFPTYLYAKSDEF